MLETSFFTIWHLGVPFISHQNLGDSKEIWEKFFWGSVANEYLGKVTEAFQKIPISFGAVVRATEFSASDQTFWGYHAARLT